MSQLDLIQKIVGWKMRRSKTELNTSAYDYCNEMIDKLQKLYDARG